MSRLPADVRTVEAPRARATVDADQGVVWLSGSERMLSPYARRAESSAGRLKKLGRSPNAPVPGMAVCPAVDPAARLAAAATIAAAATMSAADR